MLIIDNGLTPSIPNKWPACLVTGPAVTVAQAKEFIRRTDPFFVDFGKHHGNNWDWIHRTHETLGMTCLNEPNILDKENVYERWNVYETKRQQYASAWGFVELNYLDSDWVSSSYIYGPNGIVHPDGNVFYWRNIGKWPEFHEVLDDCKKLLTEFPYLKFALTLFDKEYCEEDLEKLFTLIVGDDKIEIRDDYEAVLPIPLSEEEESAYLLSRFSENREQGIPEEWIQDFSKISLPIFERLKKEWSNELAQ